MKRKTFAGQLVRGSEVLGHFVQMTKKSLARHVVLSLFLGSALGIGWFYAGSLSDAELRQLSPYVKCTVVTSVKGPAAMGGYPSLGGRLSHGDACVELSTLFGGRSPMFLAKQAAGRALLCSLVAFVALAGLLVWYGRSIQAKTRLRGARIVDVQVQKRRRRTRAAVACVGIGAALAVLFMAWDLGSARLALLGDYVATALFVKLPALGRLASLDGDGLTVWYSIGGERGFYDPAAMYAALHALFENRSVAFLFVEWLTRALALGLVPAALLAPRLAGADSRRSGNLVLASVTIPRKVEPYHMLFWGSPGSGKSTAIKELLDQIRARGEKAIVYDISGEYIELYFRPGRDHLLNPLDARSRLWSPWADASKAEDYATIGKSLFPRGGKDPFWNDASAQLFASALEALGREPGQPTNAELAELLLHSAVPAIRKQLSGTVGARFMDPEAGAMPTNLLANMAATLGVWEILGDPTGAETYFSVREFVRGQGDDWLFLSTRQDQHETLKPLLSLWCDLAASAVLSTPLSSAKRTWVILDEVASLQRMPALPLLLERGRKHGAACVLGVQSMAQLREIYGHDGAAALASHPQTWLVLRSVEPETARWLESALGSVEQDEAHESISMGASPHRDGLSIQESTHKRELVMATELINLPDLTGLLSLPGDGPIYRVKYEHKHRPTDPRVKGYEPLPVAAEPRTGDHHAQHCQREEPGAGSDVLRQRGLLPAQGGAALVPVVGSRSGGPEPAGQDRPGAAPRDPGRGASERHLAREQV